MVRKVLDSHYAMLYVINPDGMADGKGNYCNAFRIYLGLTSMIAMPQSQSLVYIAKVGSREVRKPNE